MAHFAELDANNVVTRVIVVGNPDCVDETGSESEAVGIAFCQQLFGASTVWVQTSYNGSIRKNYAGISFTYDAGRDEFVPPQPYPSWLLDEETCDWFPPIPYPEDGGPYIWDEETGGWINLTPEENVVPE